VIGKNNTSHTIRQTHTRRVPKYFQFGIGLDAFLLIPFGFSLPLDFSLFLGGTAFLESQFLLSQACGCTRLASGRLHWSGLDIQFLFGSGNSWRRWLVAILSGAIFIHPFIEFPMGGEAERKQQN
ncbi:MAG: hypothetical protein AAB286_04385, partial [Pseudomonadota bacterium]